LPDEGYDPVNMIRLALAMIAATILAVPLVLLTGGDHASMILLSPLCMIPAALIAPEFFLGGERPRLRPRR